MLSFLLIFTLTLPIGKGFYCLQCHNNQELLKKYAVEEPVKKHSPKVESCGGTPPPLKKYQKLWVSTAFLKTKMGQLGCIKCHGGQDVPGMDAHKGLIPDPSEPRNGAPVCASCHEEITQNYLKSLHFTVYGQERALEIRAGKEKIAREECERMYKNDCAKCHASCGSCHVSRPKPVKGGLLAGHKFLKTPPMETCKGCHAARTYGEYTGNFNQPADVHWREKMMACTDCHTAQELHGDGNFYTTMHRSPNNPTCLQCHSDITEKGTAHQIHAGKLSCYTCHALPTKSCYTCHEGYDESGEFYRYAEEIKMVLKIGRNYMKDSSHPYNYTTMRHPPVAPMTFDFFCGRVFKNFDAMPTWKPVSAHTIQKITPQNESCDNCHNNPSLFLTDADLKDYEKNANKPAVVNLALIPQLGGGPWPSIFNRFLFPAFIVLLVLHIAGRIAGPYIFRRKK